MKRFPILDSVGIACIPWDMIAPHEAQALKNHGQTIARLAERGGLSAAEAVAVLNGQRLGAIGTNWSVRILIHKVSDFMAEQRGEVETQAHLENLHRKVICMLKSYLDWGLEPQLADLIRNDIRLLERM